MERHSARHSTVCCRHIEKQMVTLPKDLANDAFDFHSLAVFLGRGHLRKGNPLRSRQGNVANYIESWVADLRSEIGSFGHTFYFNQVPRLQRYVRLDNFEVDPDAARGILNKQIGFFRGVIGNYSFQPY